MSPRNVDLPDHFAQNGRVSYLFDLQGYVHVPERVFLRIIRICCVSKVFEVRPVHCDETLQH